MCTVVVLFYSPSVRYFLPFFLNTSNLMSERDEASTVNVESSGRKRSYKRRDADISFSNVFYCM